MSSQETFVVRLRRHRERNGISLAEIASLTRVKRELLEAFERNDLSEWPRGLYARAWMRAYASAIGLDPIDTVDEFCRLFPHGDRRADATLLEIASIVSHRSELRDEMPAGRERRRTPRVNMLPETRWPAAVVQTARSVWTRVGGPTPAFVRAKRTPRTSS